MATAYSKDLRTKAIDALENGVPLMRVCQHFLIGRTTLYTWRTEWRKSGSVEPKKPVRPSRAAIRDLNKFEEFVSSKPDRTVKEMSQVLEVSVTSVETALRKINFTYKKNFWVSRKRSRKKENLSRKNEQN